MKSFLFPDGKRTAYLPINWMEIYKLFCKALTCELTQIKCYWRWEVCVRKRVNYAIPSGRSHSIDYMTMAGAPKFDRVPKYHCSNKPTTLLFQNVTAVLCKANDEPIASKLIFSKLKNDFAPKFSPDNLGSGGGGGIRAGFCGK